MFENMLNVGKHLKKKLFLNMFGKMFEDMLNVEQHLKMLFLKMLENV